MASFDKVAAAITSLKVAGSAKGVSRQAIKGALGDVSAARINNTLKTAVASGKLIQLKGSYKLPKPVKKAAAKKAAPKKKATKKKPAAKKSTKKKPAKKAAPKKKATKKKATKKKKSTKKK